jgi:hypothetical protein
LSNFDSLTTANVGTLDHFVSGMAQIVNSNVSNNSTLSSGWPGTLMVAGDTVSRRLSVPTGRIPHQYPMYRTNDIGTTQDPATVQGNFLFAVGDSAGTNGVKFEIQWVTTVRFFNPVDSTSITLPRPPPRSGCPPPIQGRIGISLRRSKVDEDEKAPVSMSSVEDDDLVDVRSSVARRSEERGFALLRDYIDRALAAHFAAAGVHGASTAPVPRAQ